jgi:transketolase
MQKNLLIILVVAATVVVGWFAGYCFFSHQHHAFPSNEQIMAWLKREYQLTPDQFTSIKKLQDEFRPVIKIQVQMLRQKKEYLKNLESNPAAKPDELAKAKDEMNVAKENVRSLLKAHVERVAALMNPEQAARYLKKMEEHHLH